MTRMCYEEKGKEVYRKSSAHAQRKILDPCLCWRFRKQSMSRLESRVARLTSRGENDGMQGTPLTPTNTDTFACHMHGLSLPSLILESSLLKVEIPSLNFALRSRCRC